MTAWYSRAARKWAQGTVHEVSGQLIDRRRQTLSFGVAAYPPLRDARDLLDEALDSLMTPSAAAPAEVVVIPAGAERVAELPVAVAL